MKKEIRINGTTYYIQSKDDAISLAHMLAKKGYSMAEIAVLLGVNVKTVKQYMSDCW